MTTLIRITHLSHGMRIEEPDRSWFETPFFRRRMGITSMEQGKQLKACGMGRTINMDAGKQVVSETADSDVFVFTDWKNASSSSCCIRDRLVNASGYPRTLLALPLGRNLKIDESLLSHRCHRSGQHRHSLHDLS